jgi:hypothetical protein
MTRLSGRSLGLFAILLSACVGSDDTQTIEGRVDRAGFTGTVLGARVVSGDHVVATAPVDSDGDFTLDVPVGTGYRLEVITSTGAQPLVAYATGTIVSFDVCAPVDPYDLGDIYQGDAWPGCDDPTDPNCCVDTDGDGNCDDPGDPPGCDASTDPNCCVDADGDGICDGTPPGCDPSTGENCCENPLPDGSCGGTGCDPATDPNCCVDVDNDGNCDPPGGCTDPNDPTCNGGCTNPNPDGTCGDPTCTDIDGDGICDNVPPGCDPSTGENCCTDPTDPNCGGGTGCTNPNPDGSCGDPTCTDANGDNVCDDPNVPPGCDPSTGENCGCSDPNNDGTCDCPYDDPSLCWPTPDGTPCDANGVCDPGDSAIPEEDLPDFGCENW